MTSPILTVIYMVELWFGCFEYYQYIQVWQYMILCGVGAKPVAHLMQYHLLQREVAKVKQLMTSNITLTVLNLHQKTPKGATTKIQVKRYKRDIREINSIRYPRRDIKYARSKGQIQVAP